MTVNQAIEASDLGKLTYTPPANANGDGYASFTFKVSDGIAESAASYTMTLDVSAVNDAPTGSNKTVTTAEDTPYALKAADFGFADVDTDDALASVKITALPGTGKGTLELDGTAVTANGSVTKAQLEAGNLVYTPPANANGTGYASFTFKVSDGAAESASAYTMTVDVTAANDAPTGASKTVTLAEDGSYTFKAADFGFADTDSGDALASVKIATLPGPGKGSLALDGTAVTANQAIEASDLGKLTYTPPANANGDGYASFTFKVSDGIAESAASYTMTLDVSAVNDPATGLPTISGTARVGQTLTADASAIADDADGLPEVSTFSWQWLRVSGGIDTAISGATSKTYTVAPADAGKKFKVTVSFTDLDGHPEALTSVAYPTDRQVSANAAPTGSDKTVTVAEDGSYTFKTADFGFADTDSGDALASVKIATLPGPGKGSLALDGTAVTANQAIEASDLGKLTYTPPANANGDGYASFTFKVSDGIAESAASYTMTLDVSAVNDPATGLPTISGTARVGPDPDGGRERDRRRCGRPARGLDLLLAVAAGVGRDRHRDLGGDVEDLHGGAGGRGEEVQGDGELHRPRRPPRGADQRRLPRECAGGGERRADRREQDGDGGGGRVLHVRRGRFRLHRHGLGGRACERERDAPGLGQGDAEAGHDGGDGEPGDRGFGPRQAHLHPAGERQR